MDRGGRVLCVAKYPAVEACEGLGNASNGRLAEVGSLVPGPS